MSSVKSSHGAASLNTGAAFFIPTHIPRQGRGTPEQVLPRVRWRILRDRSLSLRLAFLAPAFRWVRQSLKHRLLPLRQDVVQPDVPANLERIVWLTAVLALLPAEDRELLLRRYWKRESWKKIAADMHIRPNTLSQRHLRIMRKLRSLGESHFSSENLSDSPTLHDL
jgi:hypothetical protein